MMVPRLLCWTFFLFFSLELQANYPYYYFDYKNINIPESSFRRYIKPQVKNIITEYYHLLKKLNPTIGNLVEIKLKINDFKLKWRGWEKQCRQLNEDCTHYTQELFNLIRQVDHLTLKTQSGPLIKFKQDEQIINAQIHLVTLLGQISTANYQLLHFLEETLITLQTGYFPYSQSKLEFDNMVHQLNVYSDLSLTSILSKHYRDDFYDVFKSFVSELEELNNQNMSQELFLRRLGDLNMNWNTFHMQVTKGHQNVILPDHVTTIIKVMHNRWNSILKIVLRR